MKPKHQATHYEKKKSAKNNEWIHTSIHEGLLNTKEDMLSKSHMRNYNIKLHFNFVVTHTKMLIPKLMTLTETGHNLKRKSLKIRKH